MFGCCAIQNMLRVIQEDLIVVQLSIVNEVAVGPAGAQLVGFLRMGHRLVGERAPRSLADLPASTPQADTFAKKLKSQGYRFVGPTSVYAFMQNNGVVNSRLLPRRGLHPAAHDLGTGGALERLPLMVHRASLGWVLQAVQIRSARGDNPHTPCRCNAPRRAAAGRRRRGTPTLDRASALRPHAISSATAARLALRSAA